MSVPFIHRYKPIHSFQSNKITIKCVDDNNNYFYCVKVHTHVRTCTQFNNMCMNSNITVLYKNLMDLKSTGKPVLDVTVCALYSNVPVVQLRGCFIVMKLCYSDLMIFFSTDITDFKQGPNFASS